MSWVNGDFGEDSLELLEERRKVCLTLVALHAAELRQWEGIKAKVDNAIHAKSRGGEAKTPAPPPAKPVEPPLKEPAKAPDSEPAAKAAEPAAKSSESPKHVEPAHKEDAIAKPELPTEPATETKAAEPVAQEGVETSDTGKPAGETTPNEPEGLAIFTEQSTNLGSLGSKPRLRGKSRAHPTMKHEPLVFTPTVVAPSQSEMEEMEKKRAVDDAAHKKPEGDVVPASPGGKPKKVQPVGFNPLLGMKPASGPALKYDKCHDCPCDDFSPDTFKKGKCTNCFHIHPASQDAPPSPAAASAPPTVASLPSEVASPPPLPTSAIPSEDEQPPPPAMPGPVPGSEESDPSSIPEAAKPDDTLKPETKTPPPVSPNTKKLIGAKGFNLGLAPVELPSEPIAKCKECGCDDFSPDSFKKTKCSNCFHIHAGAPPPPKTGPGPKHEEAAAAVPKCKDCGCGNFKPDAFKKAKCANCFHNHI